MDQNNSGFIVEDELNESDFSGVSSGIGMDPKEMVKRIQKLEDMALKSSNGKNVGEQLGMMQIGWQMGKEIGELKNKMDGMKDGMAKMKEELNELKAENKELKEEIGKLEEKDEEKFTEIEIMKKRMEELKKENGQLKEELTGNGHELREMKNEMVELKAQIVGKNAELEGKIVEKDNKIRVLESAFNGFKDEISGKNAELELDGQIAALKGEYAKLQGKTSDLEKQFDNLPFLTKIIDGIQWARYNSKEYKSHLKAGPKLTISRKEFIAKHAGPNGTNIVLATMPIPGFNRWRKNKLTIAFYFEIEILSSSLKCNAGIVIGFCGKSFQLEGNWLGNENTDSIGIRQKGVMQIDGCLHKFGNTNGYFNEGDFVGIGIIHHKKNSKMECFGTWNGKLMGKIELPSKFVDLPLFPAINLYYAGDSIRINFDMDKFQFKKFGHAIQNEK